jgi:DNA-binding FadR family transcriptional regulator
MISDIWTSDKMANITDIKFTAKSVSRSTLSDQVIQTMIRDIVVGGTTSEQPLPTEHRLATQFCVSRGVIREAIRVLVAKGLVQVQHGRGMRVAPRSAWDPLDTDIMRALCERNESDESWRYLAEARRIIEVETAMLAASRRSSEDLAAMGDALHRMRDANHDAERYRRADIDFHMCVALAARNPILRRILDPVHDLLTVGGLRVPDSLDRQRSLEDHHRVLDAIEAGDGERARATMAVLFPAPAEFDPCKLTART